MRSAGSDCGALYLAVRADLISWLHFSGDANAKRNSKVGQSDQGLRFLQPDGDTKDVFVHISAVGRAGLRNLQEGQKVSYEVQVDRSKEAAGNLKT